MAKIQQKLTRFKKKLLDFQIAEQKVANQTGAVEDKLQQLKQAESEASSETAQFQQKMSKLKAEQDQLKSASDRLTSEYDMQKAALGSTATEAEKFALAQKHTEQQTENTKRVINNLEQQLKLTENAYGKNSVEANQMAAKLNNAKASISKMDNELQNLKTGSEGSADAMEELGKKVSAGNFLHAAEILADVGEKVIEIGRGAFESALDLDDAANRTNIALGLTGKEAERTKQSISNLVKDGVAGSYDEASDAIVKVRNNMGQMASDGAVELVSKKALNFARIFDTDINESIRGGERSYECLQYRC